MRAVEKIGENAFQDCNSLLEVELFEVKSTKNVFGNCFLLQYVDLKKSKSSINDFTGCSLTYLNCPSLINLVGDLRVKKSPQDLTKFGIKAEKCEF